MFAKLKPFLLIGLVLLGAAVLWKVLQAGLTTRVETTTVERETAIDAVPAIVNVRSDFAMTLSSEESGRIQESALQLGKKIREGDLILSIDPTDLEIDARILRADIENLEARLALDTAKKTELRNREEDLANFERLFRLGNYPELEIIRQRRELEVFKESQELLRLSEAQQLNTLKAQLERLERRIEKTRIYAPTDGIVTEIQAYPGELVGSGATLATVFSEAIVVEARINEEDFAGIQPGLSASVRLLTYGNELFDARVSRVLPTADKENQQYTVFLELEIDPGRLLPGLSGEASIIRRDIPNALVIPRRALLGDFVFKVEAGIAVFTPVQVGVRGLDHVEITGGLAAGDRVITDGMAGLKDGARIADE